MAQIAELGPADPEAPTVLSAVVRRPPADVNDSLAVAIPELDEELLYEIRFWTARGMTLPAEDDEAVVTFTETGEPWMVSYWSAAGNDPGDGGPEEDPVALPLIAAEEGARIAADATKQPLAAVLSALADLPAEADQLPYFTAPGAAALTTLSAFIREFLDDADAATARATLGIDAQALVPTGALLPFGSGAVPDGWLLCDGSSFLRTAYAALFAVIGSTYGAADGTHFNVPDLRGRVPVGEDGTAGRLTANDALGNSSGAEQHTLATAEMPAHTHGAGSYAVGSESAHTHGAGSYAVGSESAHTHGVGTLAVASHTHGPGTLATDTVAAHSHNMNQSANTPTTGGANRANDTTGVGGLQVTSSAGAHSHAVTAGVSAATAPALSGSTAAGSSHTHGFSGTSGAGSSHTHSLSGSSGSAGSGNAHNNMQPFQIVNYIIKT